MQYDAPRIESRQFVQALLSGWGGWRSPGHGGGGGGNHS